MDDYWNRFLLSGSVDDYLKYKIKDTNIKSENKYADNGERYNNKRTDNRGE